MVREIENKQLKTRMRKTLSAFDPVVRLARLKTTLCACNQRD